MSISFSARSFETPASSLLDSCKWSDLSKLSGMFGKERCVFTCDITRNCQLATRSLIDGARTPPRSSCLSLPISKFSPTVNPQTITHLKFTQNAIPTTMPHQQLERRANRRSKHQVVHSRQSRCANAYELPNGCFRFSVLQKKPPIDGQEHCFEQLSLMKSSICT